VKDNAQKGLLLRSVQVTRDFGRLNVVFKGELGSGHPPLLT